MILLSIGYEKQEILDWKINLPMNIDRIFTHTFRDTGKYNNRKEKLYDYIIESNDKYSKIIYDVEVKNDIDY